MDKKKLFAIIAAILVLCAVVLLIVLTKSERPNENEKPSPTPVPTQTAQPTDAPVPTAELTATPVPTDAATPAPTEAATPVPTGEPTPEPTQVAGATPTPALPQLWEEWKSQGLVEGESMLEDGTMYYAEYIPLDDGGHMEVYKDTPGDNDYGSDLIYVFDSEMALENVEIPKPESPYTKDKANGTVRCAFSVQVGDDVVMEFWTNDCVYLKGSGRTWDYPVIGAAHETELDHAINRAARDYFYYDFIGGIYNVSTGEWNSSSYDVSSMVAIAENDQRDFFNAIKTIHIGSGITYVGENIYQEYQSGIYANGEAYEFGWKAVYD